MGVSQEQVAIIFFITTCIFIQGGFAIKCWVCGSYLDPKCGDPFDNTSVAMTDCEYEPDLENLPGVKPTMCRKIRQKVYNRVVVFRTCAWPRSTNDTVDECNANTFNTISHSKVEFCETCDKDACNGAQGLSSTGLWKALIPVCIALFMRN